MSMDGSVKSSNLQLPSPFSAIAISACIFGFFHLTSPFRFAERYDNGTWLLFLVNLLAISSPAIIHRFRQQDRQWFVTVKTGIPKDARFLHIGIWVILLLSLLGGFLKCYDLFLARGFSLDSNVNELYEQNSEVTASFAGLIASLLYPLGYPTLVVLLGMIREQPDKKSKWMLGVGLAVLACVVAPLNAVALGKRGAVFSVTILVSLALLYYGVRLRKRTMVFGLMGVFVLMLFSSRMFSHRLELKGASSEGAVSIGRFTDLLDMSPGYRSFAKNSETPEMVRSTMYDWAAFHAYVVHGVPEYLYAVENFDPSAHQHGRFTFSLAAKFFSYFTNIYYDSAETASVPPRTFIYSTLFGPMFYDFGRASVFMSLTIGVLLVVVFEKSRTNVFFAPLYLYIYTVVFLSPMICFITLFYGFYYLTACVIAAVYFSICSKVKPAGITYKRINHA